MYPLVETQLCIQCCTVDSELSPWHSPSVFRPPSGLDRTRAPKFFFQQLLMNWMKLIIFFLQTHRVVPRHLQGWTHTAAESSESVAKQTQQYLLS